MSLRVQLLGLGLLTLVLPWAGYRYVQELEGALRNGLEQGLLASANTIATALRDYPLAAWRAMASDDPRATIYAPPLEAQPLLDGYSTDWNLSDDAARAIGTSGRYWAGVFDRSLYLFVTVLDATPVYQANPAQPPYGDRALLLPQGQGASWLLLHTSAPGILRAQATQAPQYIPTGRYEDRVLAYWRETAAGFAIEVRMPLDLAGDRLGLAFVDVDPGPEADGSTGAPAYAVSLDSTWPLTADTPEALVFRPAALAAVGQQFEQAGKRLRIVDRDGWVAFDGGAIDPLAQIVAPEPVGLSARLLRLILAHDDPVYAELAKPPGYLADPRLRSALSGTPTLQWYARGTAASAVVAAATPITAGGGIVGAVLLEQTSDSILTLTNDALVELMSFTLVASLLVAAGLLSYASFLSFRVRRLARAADTALSPQGEIDPDLPGRRARDELGDLARSFTALLGRLRAHTQYLTTLKGKLAHELRTPLAVVTTSLENLEREPRDGDPQPYLKRLKEGADRLDKILAAMSEATALEHAVTATTREPFDIDAVVSGCVEGYRDIYSDRTITYANKTRACSVLGSADLIAQMLDKLTDNAVSFSPEGSTIVIELGAAGREFALTIRNEGPPLPESMRASIFDSLVTVRDPAGRQGHLGLGLYIVALIAEFHGGGVSANDLPNGLGVEFTVTLPRSD
jgi:dedicated sortase system histidine kinase